MIRPRRIRTAPIVAFTGTTLFTSLVACAASITDSTTPEPPTSQRAAEAKVIALDGLEGGIILAGADASDEALVVVRTAADAPYVAMLQRDSDNDDDRPMVGIMMTPNEDGVQISGVVPESPAARAGLDTGDVIIAACDDENLSDMKSVDAETLGDWIADRRPGDAMTLKVRRGDDTFVKTVRLARWDAERMEGSDEEWDQEDMDMDSWNAARALLGDLMGEGEVSIVIDAHSDDPDHDFDPEEMAEMIRAMVADRFEGGEVSMDIDFFEHRFEDDHSEGMPFTEEEHEGMFEIENMFEMVDKVMHEAFGELEDRFHDFRREAQEWGEGIDERFHHLAEEAGHRFEEFHRHLEEVAHASDERADAMRREVEMHLRERELERREAMMQLQEQLTQSGREIEDVLRRMNERNRMLEERVQRLEMVVRRLGGMEQGPDESARRNRRPRPDRDDRDDRRRD